MASASNIEHFMLRKERHRKMVQLGKYPKSTGSKFIVPCFQRSFGFRVSQYSKHSDKLEQYIQKESFQSFVKKANQIIDNELLQKAKSQSSDFFGMTSLYLKLSIVVGILTFTILSMIVYMDFDKQKEDAILKASVALIIISVVIASICPIYLYLRKYTEYNFEEIVKKALDELAEEENEKNLREDKSYLKWSFQKSFFWIQLDINVEAVVLKAKDSRVKIDTNEKIEKNSQRKE